MEILNTETIADLSTVDLSDSSWMIHSDYSGNASKMSTPMMLNYLNGVYSTKQDLFTVNQQLPLLAKKSYVDSSNAQMNAKIDALNGGSLNVFPGNSPTAKINSYIAMTAGTYTNFGGLVVTQEEINSGIVQLNRSGSTWTKKVLLVPEIPNTIPTPSNETFDII